MNELLRSFADGEGATGTTAESVLMHLLLAFLLSQLVAWVYIRTHHGLSYSRSQVQSIILLALIVATVMMAVGNNLARAFGLFGALALVRFRTPIKDTRDTAFLFMAVAVGIGVGSQNLIIAIVGTLTLCLIMLYLDWSGFGSKNTNDAVLRFRMPADAEHESSLRKVLKRYCSQISLLQMRESGPDEALEFAYQIKFYEPDYSMGLVSEIQSLQGVDTVSILMQDQDSEL